MAKLFIEQYARAPIDWRGQTIAAGEEPSLGALTIAIGAGSAQSSALDAKTRFVRLHTDAICSVKIGANPTATTDDKRMAANQTEFFGIDNQAGTLKVAVIANT